MYIAERNKLQISVYSDKENFFEDTHNKVHISNARMKAWSLLPEVYDKGTPEYDILDKHFKLVNLFAEKIEVPNKKVESDREGTSKLIRKGSVIEIARRYRRKDGTYTNTTKTPNCCYIDNATRDKFFKAVKEHGVIEQTPFGDKYLLTSASGAIFDLWSRAIDLEYARLSGINPTQRRVQTFISVPKECEKEIQELRFSLAYSLTFNEGTPLEAYIKRNKTKECVYDIDGIFLQYVEDPVDINAMLRAIEKIPLDRLPYLLATVKF